MTKRLATDLELCQLEDYGDSMRLNLMGADESKERSYRFLITFMDMPEIRGDIIFD